MPWKRASTAGWIFSRSVQRGELQRTIKSFQEGGAESSHFELALMNFSFFSGSSFISAASTQGKSQDTLCGTEYFLHAQAEISIHDHHFSRGHRAPCHVKFGRLIDQLIEFHNRPGH